MTSEHSDIEHRLAGLADDIDWPSVDVSGGVRQRILSTPSTAPRPMLRRRVAAVVLGALVVILAVPSGRQAIADLLGVAGIEITRTDETPHADSVRLDLGERVSLEHATGRLPFPLSLPALAEMGPPDGIHLEEGQPLVVHAVWDAGPALPAVERTGMGLLLTQFESPADQTVFSKALSERTSVELTAVGDAPAQWIEGAPHQLTYQTVDGSRTRDVSRLAANVLIWERAGVTYRLETALDLESSLRIAETISPAAR